MAKLHNPRALLLLLGVLFLTFSAAAQKAEGLESGTLQEQFDFLLKKSNRYEQYRVVPTTWLNTFWSHVADTLSLQKVELLRDKGTIKEQQTNIEELKNNTQTLQAQIDSLEKTKESMSFLGLQVNKVTYNLIMWLLVAGLIGGLVTYVLRFKNANAVTKKTLAKNLSLQEELDSQRKRMLEKEQVLRRQLQDEINKNNANKDKK